MRPPGGVPTAHQDTYIRSLLPPEELWPVFDYSAEHLRHYPDRFNAAQLLDWAIDAGAAEKPVFFHEDTAWTYRHLRDRVERIAHVLVQDFGLVPGDRVLLRCTNTPMAAACWLAVLKAGGICVTTMPLLRAREIGFILEKAQVAFALCEAALAEEMEAARPGAASLRRVAYFSACGDGRDAAAGFDAMVEQAPTGAGTVATAADDLALITFTSGTTGNPKGAAHFHRDIIAVADCWPRMYSLQPDEIVCGSPSFAFTYGLAAFLIYPLRYGAAAALVSKPTAETILATVARRRVTSLYAVPTMFNAMLADVGGHDLSSLRKCTSAGEHMRTRLWEDWLAATGLRIVNGLGASEMLTHFVAEHEAVERPGSTGVQVPGYTAAVLDDDGNPLPAGQRGRLGVRGPTGCRYIDDPERQRLAVRNGWNLSGDICEQDADGWFWYIDRADDMIVSSGYNISPQEVERCVLEHPQVAECAVVGVDDAARGRLVRACVVLKPEARAGQEMAHEIQRFVKSRIAPYKYPRDVRFLDALPKTATGKVQRYRLREI